MRYVSLFSGVGGFDTAFNSRGWECVMASEINKYANIGYETLYGHKTVGDITKVNENDVPDHDVLLAGMPCQAFSIAGLRKGFEDTRGTLFFEVARIVSAKKPKMILIENVKGLISHDEGKTLEVMLSVLSELSYTIDFTVLNSKYYGVPQNRERIFIVGILGGPAEPWKAGKKDVVRKAKERISRLDLRTFNFSWPKNDTVDSRLRDILEPVVDEKYYLSDEKTAKLLQSMNGHKSEVDDVTCINPRKVDGSQTYQQDRVYEVDGCMTTLQSEISGRFNIVEYPTDQHKDGEIHWLGSIHPDTPDYHMEVYGVLGTEGICRTLRTMQGGNREPKVLIEQFTQGEGISYALDSSYWKGLGADADRGRRTHVIEATGCSTRTRSYRGQPEQLEIRKDCLSNTVTSVNKDSMAFEVRPVLTPERGMKQQNGRIVKDDGEEAFTLTATDRHGVAIGSYPYYRIRKLTPLECFRLQGFTDEQHQALVDAGISNSQLYKLAGNAVTVNVIHALEVPLRQILEVF